MYHHFDRYKKNQNLYMRISPLKTVVFFIISCSQQREKKENKGDRVRKIRKTKLNKKLNEERDGITLTYRDI